MSARPIIMSAHSVRAILDGRKTQTRRVIRKPEKYHRTRDCAFCCPYGQPGDLLWVREKWRVERAYDDTTPASFDQRLPVDYAADDGEYWMHRAYRGRWRSPIHMPRWASRLTLRLIDVRVQRVQEISREDEIAEGVPEGSFFDSVWDSINAKRAPWSSNPYVWALTFEAIHRNIDALEEET